jgi:hypothetical protein
VDLTLPEDEVRDYEFLAQTKGALVYAAMIRLMVRRLATGAASGLLRHPLDNQQTTYARIVIPLHH